MITIRIGQSQREWRSLDEVEESWIAEQIVRRRRDGVPLCVSATIVTSHINVALQCGDCGPQGGGGRLPNDDELQIIELWRRRTEDDGHCNPGKIIAFFADLRRLL